MAGAGPTERQWREALVGYLKRQMRERGLNFADVARRLAGADASADRIWLANKLNRGTFSAVFLMQILAALDCQPKWCDEVCGDLPAGQGVVATPQPNED